jgi:DNA-binding beta-propeller fold protein YncE
MRKGTLIFALFAMLSAGCAQKPREIFTPLAKPVVFPPAPEHTRIRYIGQLATSADLKAPVPFGAALGDAIFGKKSDASMLSPYALCTDGADRLFVADSNAQLVHVFNLKSRQYQQWKPSMGVKRFSQPVGIAWDAAGKLYVSDSAAGCIFIFDRNGKTTGEIGRGIVQRPCGLAFDSKTGHLFVADTGSHQIVILSPAGQLLARLGSRGTALGQFNYPTNVAIDHQGRIYVSDSLNFRVQQFGPDFAPRRQIGRKGDLPGYFGQPKGIAVDSDDHLYVVDANFEAIQIFDASGALMLDFGAEGRGPAEFWLPAGIFIDAANRIWIADSYNRRVQVLEYVPEAQP